MFWQNSLARTKLKARKLRHRKILRQRKIKFPTAEVKIAAPQKEFFWQTLSCGILAFFVASILPNFASANLEFWISEAPLLQKNENFALAEEGFFLSPAMQTERGNREKITEIVEVLVEPGDSISTIAYRYGVSTATIIQNNEITNPNRLRTGKKLVILPVDGYLHFTKKDETVDSIAKKYKVEKDKIVAQNNLTGEETFSAEKKIIITGYVKKKAKLIARNASSPDAAKKFAPGKEFGGQIFFPCRGRYTQFYHYGHYAVDIAETGGSPIWAAEKGKIVKAQGGWNGGYGNFVIIDHGNGMKTLYAHMREIYVDVGQNVVRGQTIGYMGATGRVYGATGIHLHFEVIVNGHKKNPLAYF